MPLRCILVARNNGFHAAANRARLSQSNPGCTKNCCVDVRHQRGSAKPLGNHALRDVAQARMLSRSTGDKFPTSSMKIGKTA